VEKERGNISREEEERQSKAMKTVQAKHRRQDRGSHWLEWTVLDGTGRQGNNCWWSQRRPWGAQLESWRLWTPLVRLAQGAAAAPLSVCIHPSTTLQPPMYPRVPPDTSVQYVSLCPLYAH
jgi:hypothetical protein